MDATGLSPAVVAAFRAPATIAVVGASRDPTKLSGKPIRFLRESGFSGTIVPINREAGRVQGVRAYSSLAEAPPVDLALVAVPADATGAALADCRRHGVPLAVVFAGGFGETGPDGRDRAARLDAAVAVGPGELRVLGPNCLGFWHRSTGTTATFASVVDELETPPAGVGLATQSGGFGSALLGALDDAGIGCSWWISTGNEWDLTVVDVMEMLVEEADVDLLVVATESVRDGHGLVRAARRAEALGKAVVILKTGRSRRGAMAALSHTGSAVGDRQLFDGVFRHLGLVVADSIEEVLDVTRAVTAGRVARGRRATIVTTSGGAGVLAADDAAAVGLELAEWEGEAVRALEAGLPEYASTANPIDITATPGADALGHALRSAAAHPDTGVIVTLLANRKRDAAERVPLIGAMQRSTPTPIVVAWTGAGSKVLEALDDEGVVAYPDPTRAVRAAAALASRARPAEPARTEEPEPFALVEPSTGAGGQWHQRQDGTYLLEDETGARLLAHFGVEVVGHGIVTSVQSAQAVAERLGYPVVLKGLSTEAVHKARAGLVWLDLDGPAAVADAFRRVRTVCDAAIVQAHVPTGAEVLVGMKSTPEFGPVVLVGSGGTATELIGDGRTFLPPIDPDEAARALGRLRTVEHVGVGAAVLDAAATAVAGFSQLVVAHGRSFSEVDVNPLIIPAHREGPFRSVAVDWLFVGSGGIGGDAC